MSKDNQKTNVALSSVAASAALSVTKLVVGLLTGSIGILSEAAHSLLDLVAASMTYVAVHVSDKPADLNHPYGHSKVESVSALIETGLLFLTSAWIIYEALGRFFGHARPAEAAWYGFAVIVFSIIVDFSRSRALQKVADETKSQALAADALHFRSDIFSSFAVLVGLIGLRFGFGGADALAALVVACFVIRAGYHLGKQTIDVLVDRAPDGVMDTARLIVENITGVEHVEHIRARSLGSRNAIEITVAVNRVHTSEKVRDISHAIQSALEKNFGDDTDVVVHALPIRLEDETLIEKIRHTAARHGLSTHDIVIDESHDKIYVSYDLEVPDSLTLREAHDIASMVEDELVIELGENTEINAHIEPLRSGSIAGKNVDRNTLQTITEAIKNIARIYPEIKNIHNIIAHEADARYYVTFHCTAEGDLPIENIHDEVTAFELALKATIPAIKRLVIHTETEERS